MPDASQLLLAASAGDRLAAAELLPVVYDELRRLAAARMAAEAPGATIQATALVHEAYLRLIGSRDTAKWDNRGHFFAAAAEAKGDRAAAVARLDEMVTQWQDLRRIVEAQSKIGAASATELNKVDARLAEAKIRLARAKAAAAP